MAVVAALLVHGILLVIGRSFSIKELEAYAQSEMLQAGATFFMAVFLVILVGEAINLARDFIAGEVKVDVPAEFLDKVPCARQAIQIGTTGAEVTEEQGAAILNPGSTMDDAYDAIKCRIQAKAVEVAAIQDYIMNDKTTADQFNQLNAMVSIFGITIYRGDWNSALYKATETKRITNNLATVLIIALNAQYALADYLKANMLHIFLPLGILLRSFHFTRGAGALMMAMGIGMYFIFPVFFVLLDPGFTPSPPPKTTAQSSGPQYCYATMSNSVSVLTALQTAGMGSTAELGVAMNRNDLSKAYISLIVHPLVALFLTLVFVRYIMTVLGGEPYELMKMVGKVI